MSFSSRVKAELCALPVGSACCVTAELGAFILGASVLTLAGRGQVALTVQADSAGVIRRALRLFNAAGPFAARPRLLLGSRVAGRRQYHLAISGQDSRRLLREQGMLRQEMDGTERFSPPKRVMRRNCCRRAYLRGAFLASGYLASPRKRYLAQWRFQDLARARRLDRVLGQCGLRAALGSRRGDALVSLNGGDQVSELLKLMGAHGSVLEMENLRAEKTMTGQANRMVNCDAANLGRQLGAAGRQVAAIEAISRQRGLSSLPPALSALARLRLSRPDASLEELGQMLQPPRSKSGVAHQMRRLTELAREMESGRGEGGK